MFFKNSNDPGLKTGIFQKTDMRSRNTVTVYRLRQTRTGNLIDYVDDGEGPTGPNQKRQRLLKAISDRVNIEGDLYPKLVADDASLGSINGLNGYPVTIQVIDDKITAAMKAAQKAQAEIKAQAEFDAEQKAPKKKRARRKKKEEETHAE